MSTNEAAADVPASDSTSDAPVQAEPARENHGAEEKQVMTIEDYKSALEKVRREAAKYRTENKELHPQVKKAREAEQVSWGELLKVQERMAALEAEKAADVDEPRSPRSARRHRIIARTWCSETFVHTDRAGFGLPILLTFAPCPDSSTPRLSLMSSAGELLVLLLARRFVPMEALEHALTTAGAD